MIAGKECGRDLPEFAPHAVRRTMNGVRRRTASLQLSFEDVRAQAPAWEENMRTAIRTMKRLAVPLVLLALLYGVSPAGADAHDESRLSGKQLKALLATARTAEDHQKIAAYYRDQAQLLSAKAQEFSERAAYLATQPATIESKQGIGCNCTSHYRYFSKIYSQQAREFEQKAAKEEEAVRKLGGASPPSR